MGAQPPALAARDDERPGARCYCGRDGCIETVLSGPGLTRDYGGITGDLADAETIAHRARAGDRAARGVLGRYQDRLARALASVVNLLDPDVIVLGGGVSNLPGLCEAVMELWGRYIFSDHVATLVVTAEHGDDSGVRGAAWLWPATADETGQ